MCTCPYLPQETFSVGNGRKAGEAVMTRIYLAFLGRILHTVNGTRKELPT